MLGSGGKSCDFALDTTLHLTEILCVLVILVISLICFAIVWYNIHGGHCRQDHHKHAIRKAQSHRHKVKVHDWNFSVDASRYVRSTRDWYPLHTNVHSRHILGVGLSLYYNSLCFLMLVSLLFWVVTYQVFARSNVSDAISLLHVNKKELLASALESQETPALVISPLAVCGHQASDQLHDSLHEFANNNCAAMGFLFCFSFGLSLAYGKFQKCNARLYDKRNQTMADYALWISGLPSSMTDEAKLRDWLQAEFRRALPFNLDRRADVEPGPVEVHGVSICYDYREERDKVDNAIWRLVGNMAKRGGAAGAAGAGIPSAFAENGRMDSRDGSSAHSSDQLLPGAHADSLDGVEEADDDEDMKAVAKGWFEGAGRLRCSGEAVVVFRYLADIDTVWGHYSRNPGFLKYSEHGDPVPLKLFQAHSEPVCIAWWNMGASTQAVTSGVMKAAAKIFLMIGVVQTLLMVPFARYIVLPYAAAGEVAGGQKMVWAGIVLGNVNMFLCISIYFTSAGIGFKRKDLQDILIFWANLFLTMINTAVNLYLTAYTAYEQRGANVGLGAFFTVRSLAAIGMEQALAKNVYMMLVPGAFFIGYLMFPLMGGVIPYCWNMLLMKLIYVWACLPKPFLLILKLFLPWAPGSLDKYTARSAEKGLEPMEVGIPWDYASNIVYPSICSGMLFFVSPYVWMVFRALFFWACFYYCWNKFLHLRFFKACYYTTSRLDSNVNYAWGIPLSIVAAAWCTWAARAGKFDDPEPTAVWAKVVAVVSSFFGSFAAWVIAYTRFVQPMHLEQVPEESAPTLDQVSGDTLYNWYNCNPVYVLKCEYYFKTEDGHDIPKLRNGHPVACGSDESAVCFFEIGKEHCLLRPQEQALANRGLYSSLEFETHLERLFHLVQFRCGSRPDDYENVPLVPSDCGYLVIECSCSKPVPSSSTEIAEE